MFLPHGETGQRKGNKNLMVRRHCVMSQTLMLDFHSSSLTLYGGEEDIQSHDTITTYNAHSFSVQNTALITDLQL